MFDRSAHPGKATLLALADAELGRFEAWRTRRHIDRCWICRSHLLEIQDTVAAICRAEAADPGDVDRTAVARARWNFRLMAAEYEAERPKHQPRSLAHAMALVALAVIVAGASAWLTPRTGAERIANSAPAAASELLAGAEAQELAISAAVREERFLVEFTSSRGLRTTSRELRVISAPRAGLYSARWLDSGGGLRNAVFAAQNAEDALYSRQGGLRQVHLTRGGSRQPLYRELAGADDFAGMENAVLAWMEKQVWEPVSLAREAAAFSTLSGATLRIARQDAGLEWVAEAKWKGTTMRITLRGTERTPPVLMHIAWESPRGSGSVRFRRESRQDYPHLDSAPAWLRATALRRQPPLRQDAPLPEVTAIPGPSSRDLAGAEVEVLAALHRAGLCRHDALQIASGSESLRVTGTFTSEAERERIGAIIRSVPRATLVRTDLRVIDLSSEASGEVPGAAAPTTERSAPKAAIAEPWLRARMSGETRSSQRDMFNRMTSLVGGSVEVLADTWAVETLAEYFPPDRQELLEPRDRDLLLAMVQDHAKSAAARLTQIDEQLAFDPKSGPLRHSSPTGHWQDQVPAVRKAARQLCEEILRFFASSDGAPSGASANPENSDLPGLLRQLLVRTPALADSAISPMVSR